MDACASKDNLMQFIEQLDLTELDKVILKDLQNQEGSGEKRAICGGIDLNIIEGNFTQTLFYCA